MAKSKRSTKVIKGGSKVYKNYLDNKDALYTIIGSKYTTKEELLNIRNKLNEEANRRLYVAWERKYVKGESISDISEFRGMKSRINEKGYIPYTDSSKSTKEELQKQIINRVEFLSKKTSTTKGYLAEEAARNKRIREKIARGIFGDEDEQHRIKITKQQYKDIGKLLDRMKAASVISDTKGVTGGVHNSEDILQRALQYAYENRKTKSVDEWYDYAWKIYQDALATHNEQYYVDEEDFAATI